MPEPTLNSQPQDSLWPVMKRLNQLQGQYYREREWRRKSTVFLFLNTLVPIATLVWGIANNYRGRTFLGYAFLSCSAVLWLNAGLYLKFRRLTISANVMGTVIFLTITLPLYTTSAIGMPGLYFMAILPLFMVALTNIRYGLLWSAICVANLVCVGIAGRMDYERLYDIPNYQQHNLATAGSICLMILTAALAYAYEWTKKGAFLQLQEGNQKLRAAMEKAEEASIAKSRFLAIMSHEVRTPMNGVIGTLELMDDVDLNEEAQELKGLAQDSAQSLLELLDDIIDLSRVEAGKMALEAQPFNLYMLAHQTIKLFEASAKRTEIELSLSYPDHLPRLVRGDPTRIRQIFANLIGNAIKFTPKGSVRMVVTGAENETHASLSFEIIDTGVGIAEEKLKTIFDVFTQADDSASRRHDGTGLGLALCYRLAKLMNGRLEVHSKLGQGSTFCLTLSLPLAPPTASDHSAAA